MNITARSMKVQDTQYIFPPRAQDAIPLSDAGLFAELGWIAQLKYNDSRCLIKYLPNGSIELWNRHAERFRDYEPPTWLLDQLDTVAQRLNLSRTSWTLLDGGLIHAKHAAIKHTIVIWDILVLDGQHLLGSTYGDRYNHLTSQLATASPFLYSGKGCADLNIGIKIADNILMPSNHPDNWPGIWENVIERANAFWTIGKPGDKNYDIKPLIEGLVFKDLDGKLEMGYKEKNNSKWMCRSRVETGRHRF
jgi:hypothetical protein